MCRGRGPATRAGQHDDATLLAVAVTGGPPEPLVLELASSDPTALQRVRREMATWLRAVGAGEDDVIDVNLAVGEAVANAVEHGYRDAPGPVRVTAVLGGDGRASISITDHGRWQEPAPDRRHRGRGLGLIHHSVDNVELESLAQGGTLVTFDRTLRRDPVWGASGAPDRPAGRAGGVSDDELQVTQPQPGTPTAVVSGAVDMMSVELLRNRLTDIGRGGLLPLTVDLAAVTHLGSAGIALLYEIAEDMVHAGHTLRLLAPPDSPAGQAVRLSGLDAITALLDGAVVAVP